MSEISKVITDPTAIPNGGKIPVIAEIGINHNGSIQLAKDLISVAKEAGCDAVKFQKRTVDIVYDDEILSAPRESPWGNTQRDQKEGLEFGSREYDDIDAYCKSVGIDWSASAWDKPSLEFIEGYHPKFHKVASAMITNIGFLEAVAEKGRPTLVSTGMSSEEQIDKAVQIFEKHSTPFMLMHAVSTYPTPEEDLNLELIHSLAEKYKVAVGYSGHEPSVTPSIIAAAMGAKVIERHITLSRTMYGSDQAASLEPQGLKRLVETLRRLPVMRGDGVKRLAPGEKEVASKLRYWE